MTRMERPTATMARLLPRRRVIRRYRSPRKVSVLLAATAASPSTRARYGLPCPVDPWPLRLPADSLTPGANLAHDTRCPAVGNRVMSVPSSAMSSCAASWPIPGISSSRSTASVNGAISSASLASSSARPASSAFTRASILPNKKACWSVKNPVNASANGPSLARRRVRASRAGDLGVALSSDQCGQHGPAGDPEDVAGHHREFDLGVLQQLLDPLLLGGPRRHQIGPVAGHVPQLPDRRWWDEAGPQHLPLGELAQPDRIQGVGLRTPRKVLDVTGIDQPRLEPVGFQQVAEAPFQ